MEPTANQTNDIYHWVAWAHARRKQLALGTAVAAAAGFGIWLYSWNGSHRETVASEALSELKPPPRAPGALHEPIPATELVKVAGEHPGTEAAVRAELLAAGSFFESGKFKEAQGQFEKFIANHPDSPWLSEAQLGVAASLEAEGKTDDAITHYKQFADHHPQDLNLPQAKSTLARLYLAQNKPDLALKLYQEVARERNNDSWTMEASTRAEELLASHPELRPKPVPEAPVVPAPASAPVFSLPGAPPGLQMPAPAAVKTEPVKTPAATNANKPK
jgi:outer membrane protein assembly factor BamD (BamD/ComL family)